MSGYINNDVAEKLTFSPLIRPYVTPCAEIAAGAPDPWSAESIGNIIADPSRWCFVALLGEQPVGFACFYAVAQSTDLELLAVHPQYQKMGVGRRLLIHSLTELREQGIERCLLELRASNSKALALYEKFGFKRMAVRKDMYSNPREDGYLMGILLGKPKSKRED